MVLCYFCMKKNTMTRLFGHALYDGPYRSTDIKLLTNFLLIDDFQYHYGTG